MRKLILFTLLTLTFVLPAIAQTVSEPAASRATFGKPDQPPTCGTPEINKAKALYRKTTPNVKASAWLSQLIELRADGNRTPEQLAVLNETIPLISPDLFARKTTLPVGLKERAMEAFKDEKAKVMTLDEGGRLYLAKHTPITFEPKITPVSFLPPACTCQMFYSSCAMLYPGGYGNPAGATCSRVSESNGCSTTIEGCGFLWLDTCDGMCIAR